MSRRFLTEFSKTQTNRDWQDIMKDFKREACPVPREYDDERDQVVNHYSNFTMHNYDIGPAEVGVGFGGTCAYGLPGRRVRDGAGHVGLDRPRRPQHHPRPRSPHRGVFDDGLALVAVLEPPPGDRQSLLSEMSQC